MPWAPNEGEQRIALSAMCDLSAVPFSADLLDDPERQLARRKSRLADLKGAMASLLINSANGRPANKHSVHSQN
jgi:hypothetical protein